MKINSDALLVAAASYRLSRAVTTDAIGGWLVRDPASRWASDDLGLPFDIADGDPATWRQKVVSGLDCPFCVGLWIGYGVLASYHLSGHNASTRALWRFVAAGLALNAVVAHVAARLD